MYRHFFWDFDGTLFDTYPAIVEAFRLALLDHGIREEPEAIFAQAIITITHAGNYYIEKYHLPSDFFTSFKAHQQMVEPKLAKPYPFAGELLAEIEERGGRSYLYTHRGASAIAYMKDCGMDGYFTGFVTKEDHFPSKPDPAALLSMLEKYQIKPGEALMTGDRGIDILAGKNAGMDSCFFNSGGIAPVQEADYTISSLEEFRQFLPPRI